WPYCSAEELRLAAVTAARTFLLDSWAPGFCKWPWLEGEQAGTRVLRPSASGCPLSTAEVSPPEGPRSATCGGQCALWTYIPGCTHRRRHVRSRAPREDEVQWLPVRHREQTFLHP